MEKVNKKIFRDRHNLEREARKFGVDSTKRIEKYYPSEEILWEGEEEDSSGEFKENLSDPGMSSISNLIQVLTDFQKVHPNAKFNVIHPAESAYSVSEYYEGIHMYIDLPKSDDELKKETEQAKAKKEREIAAEENKKAEKAKKKEQEEKKLLEELKRKYEG